MNVIGVRTRLERKKKRQQNNRKEFKKVMPKAQLIARKIRTDSASSIIEVAMATRESTGMIFNDHLLVPNRAASIAKNEIARPYDRTAMTGKLPGSEGKMMPKNIKNIPLIPFKTDRVFSSPGHGALGSGWPYLMPIKTGRLLAA